MRLAASRRASNGSQPLRTHAAARDSSRYQSCASELTLTTDGASVSASHDFGALILNFDRRLDLALRANFTLRNYEERRL